MDIRTWKRIHRSHRSRQVRVHCAYKPGRTHGKNKTTLGRLLLAAETCTDHSDLAAPWKLAQMMQIFRNHLCDLCSDLSHLLKTVVRFVGYA